MTSREKIMEALKSEVECFANRYLSYTVVGGTEDEVAYALSKVITDEREAQWLCNGMITSLGNYAFDICKGDYATGAELSRLIPKTVIVQDSGWEDDDITLYRDGKITEPAKSVCETDDNGDGTSECNITIWDESGSVIYEAMYGSVEQGFENQIITRPQPRKRKRSEKTENVKYLIITSNDTAQTGTIGKSISDNGAFSLFDTLKDAQDRLVQELTSTFGSDESDYCNNDDNDSTAWDTYCEMKEHDPSAKYVSVHSRDEYYGYEIIAIA